MKRGKYKKDMNITRKDLERMIFRLSNATGLKVWTLTKGQHHWRIETKDMLTACIQGKTKADLMNRCEAFLDGVVLTARLNSKLY